MWIRLRGEYEEVKQLIGNILGWPSELALLAPFWPFLGALVFRKLRFEKLEARCVGNALARSIALARDSKRGYRE